MIPMKDYELSPPLPRIKVESINNLFASFNEDDRMILITNRTLSNTCVIKDMSKRPNVETVIVKSHPNSSSIDNIILKISKIRPQLIVGIGGGSVMDVAKIARLQLENNELANKKGVNQKIELNLCPTTPGTGAEVTPFATVWSSKDKKKLSRFSVRFLPDLVIHDPSFLKSLPQIQFKIAILDAMAHCIDSIFNQNSTHFTHNLALSALDVIYQIYSNHESKELNTDKLQKLLMASSYGGMAIATTKTSLSHAISYQFTSKYNIPHGVSVGFSLLEILKYYRRKEIDICNMPCQINILGMESKLKCIMGAIDAESILNSYFAKIDTVTISYSEITTSPRFENSLIKPTRDSIEEIIKNSLNYTSCKITKTNFKLVD